MFRKLRNTYGGNVRNTPDEVIREILALEEAQKKLSIREKAQDNFMVFVKHVYEGFIEGLPVHGS
jgi:hypothetical protein